METDLGLQSASLSDFAGAREGADFFQALQADALGKFAHSAALKLKNARRVSRS